MDTTQPIDIRYIVSRLAPGAEFHWKGADFGTYDDIGQWRSPDIPKPTEKEVYAEWDKYQAQLKQQEQILKVLGAAIVGQDVYHLDVPALQACVALLMMKVQALTMEGKVKPLAEWLLW